MLDFQQIQFSELNINAFLKNIDWYDPWIIVLVLFHISVTAVTLMTRNHNNFQVILFLFMLLLVYCSETINKLAADNWQLFSKHQYFDANGLFISLVFCVPILLNCMLMVANWLYASRELMTQLKIAQLRSQSCRKVQILNEECKSKKEKSSNSRVKKD